MILSFVNVKGGVGKTTTAVNLAAVMARARLDVLVVDIDPQASATYALGFPASDEGTKMGAVLLGDAPAEEALRETQVQRVHLLAGDLGLAEADLHLGRKREPLKKLKAALAPLRRRYHVILLDCPAGLSLLTMNGLVASDAFCVPTVPHHLALDALERFFEGLERLKGDLGHSAHFLGIALTMVDYRTNLAHELVEDLRKEYGKKVFRTEVPMNVRVAEASGYGSTIFDWDEGSAGAVAYRRLGAEVLRRLREDGLLEA